MTKVIIVSPEEFHSYFADIYKEWDVQSPVLDFDELWDKLGSGELSDQSEIVIMNDAFYTPSDNKLEVAIANIAPTALVIVLSYEQELQDVIRKNVKDICKASGQEESSFAFVNANQDTILDEINSAIKLWNKDKNADFSNNQAASDGKPLKTGEPVSISQMHADKGATLTNADLPPLTERGVIIASTSSKGGSGKTTVALCTASMLYHASRVAAEQGLRDRPLNVCVVDMDVRDGQIGFLLNQVQPTVLNLYIENKNPDTEFIKTKLVKHEGMGIYALLAPKFGRTASVIKNEFYQDVIYKLSTIFDVVILDTSVNYLDKLLSDVVLPMSDKILFVTNLSKGSIFGMTRWMQEMVANKDVETYVDKNKVGVIINQAMADVGVDLELIAKQALDVPLISAIPTDSSAVVRATNLYRLQDIILTHEEISKEYYRIAKKIVEMMPGDDAFIANPIDETVFARPELLDKLRAANQGDIDLKPKSEDVASPDESQEVIPSRSGGLFK
jgi:cellulose biosynthesis protein BcsQ